MRKDCQSDDDMHRTCSITTETTIRGTRCVLLQPPGDDGFKIRITTLPFISCLDTKDGTFCLDCLFPTPPAAPFLLTLIPMLMRTGITPPSQLQQQLSLPGPSAILQNAAQQGLLQNKNSQWSDSTQRMVAQSGGAT